MRALRIPIAPLLVAAIAVGCDLGRTTSPSVDGLVPQFQLGAPGGTFSATGSLLTGRDQHIAVRLPSGKILVAGGGVGGPFGLDATTTAELFNPATDSWTATGSMTHARFGHTAVLLPNGRVLVSGGTPRNSCTGAPVGNSAEIFDPMTGTWTLTSNMNVPRNAAAAVLLANGKVLVAGGENRCGSIFNSAEIFDPATGTWAVTGSMNDARGAAAHVLLPNGKVLVAGGTSAALNSLASAEIFDPATGTWTRTGSMQNPRHWLSFDSSPSDGLIPLSNGKVLTVGGETFRVTPALTAAELFDPATGTWTVIGNLGTARNLHRATLLTTGQVLVTGPGNNSAELFDPATGTSSPAGNMTSARTFHTATLLLDGRVLLAGGRNAIRSAEIFDPILKITVAIDIKPGSDPNSINTKSKGVIPVAILGSASFDVTDVDVTTLTFGPGGATPSHKAGGHIEDVNDDGFDDLVSHYRTQETGLASGDTDACVTGLTNGGQPFEGCDAVNIVK